MYEKVVKLFPELVSEAEEKGINVREISEDYFSKYGDRYKEKTILTRIRAELKNRLRLAESKRVKVFIAGSRDRYGKNYPIRIAGLRPDGKHVEISTWSHDAVRYGNTTVELPVPAIATVAVRENDEYGSLDLIELVDYRMLERDEVIKFLEKVAVNPSDIKASDEFRVVVVKGNVRGVYPATKFEDGEPVGSLSVLSEDQRDKPDLHPTMQIWLEADNNTRTRLVLERPRYSRPYYDITDFMLLCEDAMKYPDTLKQCEYVRSGIEGETIYAVGVVTRYNKTRDNEGNDVNYVDIGVSAIYEDTNFGLPIESVEGSISDVEWIPVDIDDMESKYTKLKEKLSASGKQLKIPTSIQRYVENGYRMFGGVYATSNGKIVSGIRFKDSMDVKCSCGKKMCVHLIGLWSVVRKEILDSIKDSVSKVSKLENIVRAMVRGLNINPNQLNADMVYDKMPGISDKEYPRSVVEAVIEKIRSDSSGNSG